MSFRRPSTHLLVAILICFWTIAAPAWAEERTADPSSPCYAAIHELEETYYSDPVFRSLVDSAFASMEKTPSGYMENPWVGKSFPDLVTFLNEWSTFLPTANGSHDDGLKYIGHMALFYYQNPYARKVVQSYPGADIFKAFVRQRGVFMDSEASAAKVAEWLAEPRMETEDYALPDPDAADGGFRSFNEFFSRSLKDQAKSRPQTMPERDYIISAPTDAIMNSIPQKIVDANTPIATKGNQALNIVDLLDGSKYAEKFVGGTALSCVLMPNTYHRYHSPIDGKVVEAKIVEGVFFGHPDFPRWVPADGNVGYASDFSPFEDFQRGYFIADTGKYGHVAMVPVGLNTISSVIFEDKFLKMSGPVPIKRGDELGHFLYGGSLFIMIFEPGAYGSDAIQVRLGNQIGTFDTGK
jgi:phosphatidylserine decarboxylase